MDKIRIFIVLLKKILFKTFWIEMIKIFKQLMLLEKYLENKKILWNKSKI
jgi:hypothetical protein